MLSIKASEMPNFASCSLRFGTFSTALWTIVGSSFRNSSFLNIPARSFDNTAPTLPDPIIETALVIRLSNALVCLTFSASVGSFGAFKIISKSALIVWTCSVDTLVKTASTKLSPAGSICS